MQRAVGESHAGVRQIAGVRAARPVDVGGEVGCAEGKIAVIARLQLVGQPLVVAVQFYPQAGDCQ